MRLLKLSTAYGLMVFMTDAADHVAGKAGLTLTVTASKAGGAFAAITPTVTERGSGWYSLALTAAHTDTEGDLALHVTATGADASDLACQVMVMGSTVDSNTVQVAGSTAAATNLSAQMLAQFLAVVSADASATTTSFTANTTGSPGLSATAGKYVGAAVAFYGGGEAPLARKVTAYTYSGGVGTFTIAPALDAAPATDGTAKFILLGYLS